MGRKQKLRQVAKIKEKKNNKELKSTLSPVNKKLSTVFITTPRENFMWLLFLSIFWFCTSLWFLFLFYRIMGIGWKVRSTTIAIVVSGLIAQIQIAILKKSLFYQVTIANNRCAGTDLQKDFPESDTLLQAFKLLKDNNVKLAIARCMDGAIEYGCVLSMYMLSVIHGASNSKGKLNIHLSQPWLLEGSIRGSSCVTTALVAAYLKNVPVQSKSLMAYWIEMNCKYCEWSGASKIVKNSEMEAIKNDTAEEPTHNHRAECNQLKILNKYHKPYAKEIREAAIRGESHPALEELRHRLGLTRPIKDYYVLQNSHIHKGKPINPKDYIIARDDGTVWIGSFPISATSAKDD